MKTEKKIWLRLFLNIAGIFTVFVLCVALAGSTLFVRYYTDYEKRQMRACARRVAGIELDERESALASLKSAEAEYNVALTVYRDRSPVYSTLGRPYSGGYRPELDGFDLIINRAEKDVKVIERQSDGEEGVFSLISSSNVEILTYLYEPADSPVSVEVFMEKTLIQNSAAAAGRFTLLIAGFCLVGALVWSVLFARRFTRPIERMNSVAQNMARLDFSLAVDVEREDELGTLGRSLNELSASLDRALAELNERNRSLQSEIESERRLDEMRKAFVANVSHELKTPISIIQGYAEGLNGPMAEDEQLRRKYCQVILDESRRMHDLVIGLLELSRYESGAGCKQGRFDLSSSLINLADRIQSTVQKNKVSFELSFPERLEAGGDRLMMEQVIQNYLSNAVSHVNEGGVIRLYTEPDENGTVRVCVYNSGSHIEPDQLESVWQSFWRADKAHNRSAGRYGLGLSVVRAIMTSYGCEYGVFNTDDGVTFYAQMPPPAD